MEQAYLFPLVGGIINVTPHSTHIPVPGNTIAYCLAEEVNLFADGMEVPEDPSEYIRKYYYFYLTCITTPLKKDPSSH